MSKLSERKKNLSDMRKNQAAQCKFQNKVGSNQGTNQNKPATSKKVGPAVSAYPIPDKGAAPSQAHSSMPPPPPRFEPQLENQNEDQMTINTMLGTKKRKETEASTDAAFASVENLTFASVRSASDKKFSILEPNAPHKFMEQIYQPCLDRALFNQFSTEDLHGQASVFMHSLARGISLMGCYRDERVRMEKENQHLREDLKEKNHNVSLLKENLRGAGQLRDSLENKVILKDKEIIRLNEALAAADRSLYQLTKEKEDISAALQKALDEKTKVQKEKEDVSKNFSMSIADMAKKMEEERKRHEEDQLQGLADVEASFRSAICQALILNPQMNTRGISLFHFAEEGQLMISEGAVKKPVNLEDPSLTSFDPASPPTEEAENEADDATVGPDADVDKAN